MSCIDDIRFIDVEASSFDGYPIEIGWADLHLKTESHLLIPLSGWTEDEWSYESEQVHGISREDLFRSGTPAEQVAKRLNEMLSRKLVLSDAPLFDIHWLARLFADTGIRQDFFIGDYYKAVQEFTGLCLDNRPSETAALMLAVEDRYPHIHRAGHDALQMAAKWRALIDPVFVEDLYKRPSLVKDR